MLLRTCQWSKPIDDPSETQGWEVHDAVLDVFNRRLDRSISAQNLPCDFVGTLLWQLPFGHGKRFGSNLNKWADRALGGWERFGPPAAWSHSSWRNKARRKLPQK